MRFETVKLIFCLQFFTYTIVGSIRSYERILGPQAVTRLCGMENDECVSDINCCAEYECTHEGECKLRNMANLHSFERKHCVSNNDCPYGWCCAGSLFKRVCKATCPELDQPDVIPAGGYYGQQFWNLWARKRRMDHNIY